MTLEPLLGSTALDRGGLVLAQLAKSLISPAHLYRAKREALE